MPGNQVCNSLIFVVSVTVAAVLAFAIFENDSRNCYPPTQERLRRDKIEVAREQIQDSKGNPGSPFRVLTVLALMEAAGSIIKGMHAAGVRFMDDFGRSNLEPLRAADMARVPGGANENIAHAAMRARDRVWDAILALGGIGSPGGRIVWDVLGEQKDLQGWATFSGWRGRPIDPRSAKGMLAGALGTLLAHYERIDREGR